MLAFFNEVHENVKTATPMYFNMSGIRILKPDAILYMLSVFHYYEKERNFSNFMGNVPNDDSCRELLASSGFFNYVARSQWFPKGPRNTLSVKTDQYVQGKVANQVVTFAFDKLGRNKGINSKGIYATLIECMGNTRNHAYSDGTRYPRWWMIAYHDAQNKHINFSFLDNGHGIPKTMRQNFKERFLDPVLGKRNDAELILSALQGEFRTQTRQRWRGRGLPRIYEFAQRQEIDKFVIVSNFGYVNATTKDAITLPIKFHGTMLSWDFV